MECHWPDLKRGSQCVGCGYVLKHDYESPPSRGCRRELACLHLLAPTGETVLVRCQTCQGNVRQKFAVHGCAIFGQCLPTLGVDPPSGYAKCAGCPARELKLINPTPL